MPKRLENIKRLKALNLNRRVERLIPLEERFKYEDMLETIYTDPLIDYNFEYGEAINNDGKFKGIIKNCIFHKGIDGKENVLTFNKSGSHIKIPAEDRLSSISTVSVSVDIKYEETNEDRINIFENSSMGLAFMLLKKDGAYYLTASVNLANGWQKITADRPISPNKWYNLSAVFTGEEIFIFEDNKCVGRRIFQNAELKSLGARDSFIGTWGDGRRNQFKGMLASFKLWDDIPSHLNREINVAVEMGKGAIESKYIDLGGERSFLGSKMRPEKEITKSENGRNEVIGRYRDYSGGVIYWSKSTGAHEVHGNISAWYKKLRGPSGKLGFPRTDEIQGNMRGTRISRFENGAIYWSRATGAHELTNHLYAKYVTLGEDSGYHGLPTSGEEVFGKGYCVTMQKGRLFYSEETGAQEVHGAILSKYLSLNPNMNGDVKISLGLPTSDELDILDKNGSPTGKKVSNFQNGAIYWSRSTGAHEVFGSMYRKYIEAGGPSGSLGLPIHYEGYYSSGKLFLINDFEKGIIVYKGEGGDKLFENEKDIKVITSLELRLGEVVSGSIDDGIGDSSAELITFSTVKVNEKVIDNGTRRPSGHAGTSYNINTKYVIPNIKHDTKIYFKIRIEDWDRHSDNEYLGDIKKEFDISTLWGMDNDRNGIYNEHPLTRKGGDSPSLGTIRLSFAINSPSKIDSSKHFREQFWWKFDNFRGPAPLSRDFYANTFKDVNIIGDTFWEEALNPLDTAIYELAYKDIAKTGNCFGMSLEALYALKDSSLFTIPLSKYEANNDQTSPISYTQLPSYISNPINRKHGYQIGEKAVSWSINKLLSSEATSPKATFKSVKELIDRGDYPIISMLSISKGSGHAVLAYDYSEEGILKKIFVADPNYPYSERERDTDGTLGYIEINTLKDKFKFYPGTKNNDGSLMIQYQTGNVLSGLIDDTYMIEFPYHVLSSQPVTPYLSILLGLASIMGGVLIIFGDGLSEQISSGDNDFYDYSSGQKRINKKGVNGLVKLPIVDGPKDSLELYGMEGKPAESLEFIIKGRKDGTYTHHLATYNNILKVEAPIKINEKDNIYIEDANTSRPNISIKTSGLPKDVNISYSMLRDIKEKENLTYNIDIQATGEDLSLISIDPLSGSLTVSQAGSLKQISIEKEFMKDNIKVKKTLKLNPSIENEIIKIRDFEIDSINNEVLIERVNPNTGDIIGRLKDRFR